MQQMQLLLPISEPRIARSSDGLCGPWRSLRIPTSYTICTSFELFDPLDSKILLGIQGLEAAESTFVRIEAGIYTPKVNFSWYSWWIGKYIDSIFKLPQYLRWTFYQSKMDPFQCQRYFHPRLLWNSMVLTEEAQLVPSWLSVRIWGASGDNCASIFECGPRLSIRVASINGSNIERRPAKFIPWLPASIHDEMV